MNEMIERVARAIGVPEHSGLVCDWSLKAARAAIEAMLEPTSEQLEAGNHAAEHDGESITDIWRTMIDAALK